MNASNTQTKAEARRIAQHVRRLALKGGRALRPYLEAKDLARKFEPEDEGSTELAQQAIGDLLANLRHYADAAGVHFESALQDADLHYHAETTGDFV